MSSASKNLSEHNPSTLPDAHNMRFGIVVSEWNPQVTEALFKGAHETLIQQGVKPEFIHRINVPGSFELTAGAKFIAAHHKLDAVICIGCIIQGETRHFDFISQAVAIGLTQLNILSGIPFIFGVLTTDNEQQALDRSGGKHGNKGVEAAITAIKMAGLKTQEQSGKKIGFGG